VTSGARKFADMLARSARSRRQNMKDVSLSMFFGEIQRKFQKVCNFYQEIVVYYGLHVSVLQAIENFNYARFIKPCLHWQRLRDNAGDSDGHYLLVLAPLGDVTQIGLFLFLVTLPEVANASTVMTAVCLCC
jgi:hypothetical protein